MCVVETQRIRTVVLRFSEPIKVYDKDGNLVGSYKEIEMSLNQAVGLATELARLITKLVDEGEVRVE